MAESKAGSILLLIGGILTLVGALAVLIIGLLLGSFAAEDTLALMVIFIVIFFVLLITGVLKIYAAQMMKDPKRTVNGGILGLVVGILSGFDVLAIIGGILGIVDGEKK